MFPKCPKACSDEPAPLRDDAEAGSGLEQCKRESFKQNAMCLKGNRGRTVLARFTTELTDCDALIWTQLRLSAGDAFSVSLLMVCAVGDAWRRLYFQIMCQARNELFDVCHRNGQRFYDEDHISRIVDALIQRRRVCPGCIEKERTGVFLDPLSQRTSDACREAHGFLCEILRALRMSSIVVERAHIEGQEKKPPKSRGLALEADSLSAATYQGFVCQDFRNAYDNLQNNVLAMRGLTFTQLSAWSREREASKQQHVRDRPLTTHSRARCAYDLFREHHFD